MKLQVSHILIPLGLFTSGCVSKKTLLETSTAYETRLSLVREDLLAAQKRVQSLELLLAEKKGENNALTVMQQQLQAKVDELRAELRNTSSRAINLQQGLSSVIQSKDSLKNAQELLILSVDSILANRNAGLEKLRESFRDSLKTLPENNYSLILDDQQLRIVLDEQLLFKPGVTNKIELPGKKILGTIANVFSLYPQYFIWVIGHHDNQPVPRKIVADEWDYTVLRAAEVARVLIRDFELGSGRLTAGGKGQFAPLVSNETRQGQARNRRIEIVAFPAADELPKLLRQTIHFHP